jgi:ABC-2 type transport system ATP-binding protein
VRRRLIGTLSKGYRQRVGLADSLIHDPPILILDEPTAGLDPLQIRETLMLIRDLGEQHTILLSTHILSEVEAVCRRVIIINAGQIGLDKNMADLAGEEATVILEVRGPAEQVTNVLRTTDGVARVTSQPVGDGVTAFDIRTQHNRDLREAVSQRIAKNGWTIRRLDLRRRTLEDHFVDVVMREEKSYVHRRAQDGQQPGESAELPVPAATE